MIHAVLYKKVIWIAKYFILTFYSEFSFFPLAGKLEVFLPISEK